MAHSNLSPVQTQAPTTHDRNYAHMLKALRAGLTVRPGASAHSMWVSSASDPHGQHLVETYRFDGARQEYCSCQWGKRYAPFLPSSRPCAHILLVRWHRLDADLKAALLETDPVIAAAVAASPAPVLYCAAQLARAAAPAPVLYCEAQDAYLVPDVAPAAPVDKQAAYRAAYADVFGAAA